VANENDKWDKAAELLGLKDKTFFGGVEHCVFTVAQLTEVLGLGVTGLNYKFNQSPTVETFFEFGKKAEATGATVSFGGYLESKDRPDAILSVDEIKITNLPDSARLIMDFSQAFHKADEFTTNKEMLRAWFD
jgi:hypothetical protein